MPSDATDPHRQNAVDATRLPENEPTVKTEAAKKLVNDVKKAIVELKNSAEATAKSIGDVAMKLLKSIQ